MKGYLVLEDGTSFGGELEKEARCVGEAVFFTGMTGYQEVLTDPSYKGQVFRLRQLRRVLCSGCCGNFSCC